MIFLSPDPNKCLCGFRPRNRWDDHDCPLDVTTWLKAENVDWHRQDRAYWKDVYRRAREAGVGFLSTVEPDGRVWYREREVVGPPPAHNEYEEPERFRMWVVEKTPANMQRAVHFIKEQRYHERLAASRAHLHSPVAQYGEALGGPVQAALDSAVAKNGDPCIDNYRWARIGSSPDMRRYRRAQAEGCCGAHDEVVVVREFLISGIKTHRFLVGFNYGH